MMQAMGVCIWLPYAFLVLLCSIVINYQSIFRWKVNIMPMLVMHVFALPSIREHFQANRVFTKKSKFKSAAP